MTNAKHDVTPESIQAALDDLHIPFRALKAQRGPALTRFILEPVGTLDIAALDNAQDALSQALNVRAVSIVAPLPGTSLIGLDVPKAKPEIVSFEDIFTSPAMQEAASPLAFPLGKDVTGSPVISDLDRMHHLLITGVTGSGKSVCIQSMLLSLLRRNTAKDLQLVLFDAHNEYPQALTAAPHLQMPVITDARQAVDALTAAAEEATKRISLYHQAHVTPNIDKYNQQVPADQQLPRIVIVIDGLEPLMRAFPHEVKIAISQIGRFGSAAGVHLVATVQLLHPAMHASALHASIPSRISFRLPTAADSRACLEHSGAEQLLFPGDMLYKPQNEFLPIRVQGCCVRPEHFADLSE